MIKEYMPYHEYLKYDEWVWTPSSVSWKKYLRLQRNMRRLIVASVISLTVNVVLLGVIVL